jgi:uncharacterized membrane protein
VSVRAGDETRFQIWLGRLLRAGVTLAAATTLAGGAVYLARDGATAPGVRVFHGEPAALRSVAGVLGAARAGDPRGIIQAGLLILIATPIARVAASVIGFALERDGLYVAVTLVVLALLLLSVFGIA